MKILSLKVDKSKLFISITIFIALVFFVLSIIYFLDSVKAEDILKMTHENYTVILKDSHENIDKYLNKKISAIGYVYRCDDFTNKQFVIARDMIIRYPNDARIVGFLCEYDKANEFNNYVWVEITGTICKGNYYGELPLVKVESMRKVAMPEDVYVFPPSGFSEQN